MVHINVEKIREAKGITKTHLAKTIRMSLQGYRHIANGDARLDTERLKTIAHALGEDVAVFFDDKLTDSVIERMKITA